MKILISLLILLGVGTFATTQTDLVFGAETESEIPESSLFEVKRGDMRITIDENGYLKAKNSLEVQPKFKGSGTIIWLVDEGKAVEKDELLVEFDKNDLEDSISDLENKLIQYEIELEAARANLQIQERDNQASIESAELKAEMAQLTLERYREGEAPNQERKLQLAEEKARSELERAKDRFKEVPDLVAQGFLTRIEEEEERIKVKAATITLENAVKDYELYSIYTKKMELTQKQSDVKDADRNLENAREKAGINLKEKQALVQQKERQVTATEKRLEQQKEELTYYTIKAEKAGVVHYGDPTRPWMRDRIKIGNSWHKGNTLLTIPDLTEMQVLIQVHEADIDHVKKDMDVLVTVETKKGTTFEGKITTVATVASSDNWMDQTNKSFRVEITLDASEEELRAGVTAKAEILVETLADVAYIPIHAAFAREGKHYCFVWKDGQTERREVTIGKNNTSYVAITEGLEAGEKVLLYDPSADRSVIEGEDSEAGDDDGGGTGLAASLAAGGSEG